MRKRPFRGYCAAGCGKPVFARDSATKYCSLQCSSARFRKHHERKPCAVCGKIVSLVKQTYCSQQCHRAGEFERRRRLLESGGYCGVNYCNGYIRKYLVHRFGERCSRCGWDARHPLTGRVPVEVEHIDGDWRNNRVENLTLLCPNYHSLTATYRALNRGRGRAHAWAAARIPCRGRQSQNAERTERKGCAIAVVALDADVAQLVRAFAL